MDTVLSFNRDFDGHSDAYATCEQTFMIHVCFFADVSGGFSFGPNSMVVLTVKPSYERDQLIANAVAAAPIRRKRSNSDGTSRDKRSSPPHKHTVSVNLRTARDSGIVYFAGSSDEYILIQVSVALP